MKMEQDIPIQVTNKRLLLYIPLKVGGQDTDFFQKARPPSLK
jgi:hypothetical protein